MWYERCVGLCVQKMLTKNGERREERTTHIVEGRGLHAGLSPSSSLFEESCSRFWVNVVRVFDQLCVRLYVYEREKSGEKWEKEILI